MELPGGLELKVVESNVSVDRLSNTLKKAASGISGVSRSAIVLQLKGSGTEVIPWPYDVDPADFAVLYDEEPTHHACVDVKASATMSNGYKFVHNSGLPKSVPMAMRRDFEDLFPDGPEQLVSRGQKDFESLGNAWVEVVRDGTGRVKNGLGRVVQLNHIPAYTMWRLNPNTASTNGSYVQICNGTEVYFREFGSQPLEINGEWVNEVVHLINYTPSHYFYGLPAIWSALYAAMSNRLDGQNSVEYQEDKGLARYMLVMDGAHTMVDPKDEAMITNYMNSLMEKRSVKLIMVSTPAGTNSKFQALREDPHFDHLLNNRNANRDEICRVEQVPPRLIGIIAQGALGSTGEGESQFDLFKRLVVRPRQNRWERLFYNVFFANVDKRKQWGVELKEVDLADFLRRQQANVGYVRSGVFSINQVLADLGRPPLGEGGDEHFIISGGQPVKIEDIGNVDVPAARNVVGPREAQGGPDSDATSTDTSARGDTAHV